MTKSQSKSRNARVAPGKERSIQIRHEKPEKRKVDRLLNRFTDPNPGSSGGGGDGGDDELDAVGPSHNLLSQAGHLGHELAGELVVDASEH